MIFPQVAKNNVRWVRRYTQSYPSLQFVSWMVRECLLDRSLHTAQDNFLLQFDLFHSKSFPAVTKNLGQLLKWVIVSLAMEMQKSAGGTYTTLTVLVYDPVNIEGTEIFWPHIWTRKSGRQIQFMTRWVLQDGCCLTAKWHLVEGNFHWHQLPLSKFYVSLVCTEILFPKF